MKSRLILLTDKAFSSDLATSLGHAGVSDFTVAYSMADLSHILSGNLPHTCLVSFGSGVIVPPAILNVVGSAYNFHPGPPNYRGLFPSVYALYDNASTFGVTCHAMSAEIDAGAIIAVNRFAITPEMDRGALDALTYQELLKLLAQLAPVFTGASPLPQSTEQWSGPLRRKADFDALCHLPAGSDETEIQRRYRAIGEGPHHALTMDVNGTRMTISSGQTGPITRGGKAV
jgi:methionyl-tRNA formyltransferase